MKVDQLIISVRAKFIHNLRMLKLPAEFNGFVSMVDTNDENFRNLRLSNFNYCLDTDVSSPKYSICKSWNNLSFEIKSTQPDEFLDTLRNYFNSCNDKICQIENCWLCGSKWANSHDLTAHLHLYWSMTGLSGKFQMVLMFQLSWAWMLIRFITWVEGLRTLSQLKWS